MLVIHPNYLVTFGLQVDRDVEQPLAMSVSEPNLDGFLRTLRANHVEWFKVEKEPPLPVIPEPPARVGEAS